MPRIIPVGAEDFGNTYEPIPTGTKLKVAVFDITETVTGPNAKVPGQPQFVFTAKVTEDGPYKGREIRYNYISLVGGWALVAFAEAVGWPTSKETGVEVPDDLNDVLGVEFIAKIGETASQKINPETGEPYKNNRVSGYSKLGKGGTPTPEAKKSWKDL